jgi:hypothetical protein
MVTDSVSRTESRTIVRAMPSIMPALGFIQYSSMERVGERASQHPAIQPMRSTPAWA